MKAISVLTVLAALLSAAGCGNKAKEYVKQGNEKCDMSDYQGAIADYTKAIELDPKYAKAYYNRGAAKSGLEDYQGAIEDFTKAIELNLENGMAYVGRGLCKKYSGDRQGAIGDFQKARESGNKDAAWELKQL